VIVPQLTGTFESPVTSPSHGVTSSKTHCGESTPIARMNETFFRSFGRFAFHAVAASNAACM
jgi:hypothetical protein